MPIAGENMERSLYNIAVLVVMPFAKLRHNRPLRSGKGAFGV